MSKKLNTFASAIGNPQNTHIFTLVIPELSGLEVLIQSTSLPQEKLRKMTLHFQGEPISWPTVPEYEHNWSCKIPESEGAIVFRKYVAAREAIWNSQLGSLVFPLRGDIKIEMRDLNQVAVLGKILHGCWIMGLDNIEVDSSDPTKILTWSPTWHYDWSENLVLK